MVLCSLHQYGRLTVAPVASRQQLRLAMSCKGVTSNIMASHDFLNIKLNRGVLLELAGTTDGNLIRAAFNIPTSPW